MKKITRSLIALTIAMFGSFFAQAQTVDDTLGFDANISKSGYAAATVTIGNYQWELLQAIQASPADVSDKKFGANSIRMRKNGATNGYMEMKTDKPYGLGLISFYASRASFSGDASGNAPIFSVDYSTDQGTNWTSVDTVDLTGVDVLTKYTINNINVSGNVRIRLIVIGGDSGKRFNIDSLVFTGFSSPCAAPTNLALTDNADGSLTATWDAPATAPADGYKIAIVPTGTTPTAADYFTNSPSNTSPSTDTLKNGTPLINGVTYDVYLYAVCDSVGASFSDTLTASVTVTLPACESLSNLSTSTTPDGVVNVVWTAPTNVPADGYKVAIVPNGSAPTAADFFTVSSMSTILSTDTLRNGTLITSGDYDVYVYGNCNDAAVNHSDTLTTTVTVDVCKAVTNFVMTNNNDGSVTATWTAPSPVPANGYKIAVTAVGNTPSPSEYFSVPSGDVSFTTDTLINGSTFGLGATYYMTIYGECTASSHSVAQNDTSIVTDSTTCMYPGNFTAVNNNDSSITITWVAPVNLPANGYFITIVPTGQTPGSTGFVVANTETSLTTDTLQDGSTFGYNQTYDVYVGSDCGGGNTSDPYMTSVTVTFPVPCLAPTNVVLTDNEDGTMTASWTTPTYTPNDGIKLAVVKIGDTPTASDYFDVNGTATSFTTDTLANGTSLMHDSTYVVYIYSACNIANNEYSDTLIDTVHVTDVLPCNAPLNFVFNSNAGGEATATWAIPAGGGNSGFQLAIVLNGTTPTATDYFTIAPGVSTFTTDTLKNGSPLLEASIYKAYIYSACGATHVSTTESDTALIQIKPCAAPTNLVLVDNNDGTVTLTWNAASPAPNEGYLITSNSPLATNKITTSTTYTTVELPDGSYTFSVKSICNSSISNYSNGISQSIATHDTVTSVVSLTSEITAIYPNPVATTLSVDMNVSNGMMIVTDLTGKVVLDKIQITSNHTTFDVSALPVGIYQITVYTNSATSIAKFVKE